MKLNRIVYAALRVILRFNTRVYGKGSSHELCRDLAGEFSQELISVPCGRCSEVNLVLNPLAPWFCKRCHRAYNRTGVTPVPVLVWYRDLPILWFIALAITGVMALLRWRGVL